MNLIDGTSIWLKSLIQVLARPPGNEVHLLLKSPVRREPLLQDLRLCNVTLIEPFGWFSLRIKRWLKPEKAIRRLEQLFHALVVCYERAVAARANVEVPHDPEAQSMALADVYGELAH